jgi:4'-phosphopantetheinyl transferase
MAFSFGDDQVRAATSRQNLQKDLEAILPTFKLEAAGKKTLLALQDGSEIAVQVCLKPLFAWEVLAAPPVLKSGEAQVCSILLDQPENLESDAELLSPDEIDRAAKFHSAKDRAYYISSHAGLRRILGEHLGADPASLEFTFNAAGKPELADEDLQFNLSHSGDIALVAVTRDSEIGVDIEKVRPIQERDLVAKCFFAPGEVQRYHQLEEEWKATGFFQCWTRKEAYLKACGVGITNGLDSFEVALEPHTPPLLLSVRDTPDEPARWSFYHLNPCPDYIGALAVRSSTATLRTWHYQRS